MVFLQAGEFLIKADNSIVQATDDTHSYSGTITDPSAQKYLQGHPLEHPVDISVNVADDKQTAQLSLAQVYEGMRLEAATVDMTLLNKPLSISNWAFQMAGQCGDLQAKVEQQRAVISEQGRLLDEMVKAKEEYQEDMLQRVTAILHARGQLSGDVSLVKHEDASQGVDACTPPCPTPKVGSIKTELSDAETMQGSDEDTASTGEE